MYFNPSGQTRSVLRLQYWTHKQTRAYATLIVLISLARATYVGHNLRSGIKGKIGKKHGSMREERFDWRPICSLLPFDFDSSRFGDSSGLACRPMLQHGRLPIIPWPGCSIWFEREADHAEDTHAENRIRRIQFHARLPLMTFAFASASPGSGK